MATYRPGAPRRRPTGTGRKSSAMTSRTPDQVRGIMGVRQMNMSYINEGGPSSRRIDGRPYFLAYTGVKGQAKYRARQIRAAGFRARVVKAGRYGYAVYSER